MSSFTPKTNTIEQIVRSLVGAGGKIDKAIESKMNAVVNIVYLTARARRPKISVEQQKAMGRNPKGYRVSDPNAVAGVPVRTGDLQLSIKKEVFHRDGKIVGRIFIDGPGEEYAPYVEFGTSKSLPRPFMRPAIHINEDIIKKRWEEPIK